MTKVQKIIKYFAISLAVLIIVSIASTILGIISNIFGVSFNKESNEYKITEITNKINELDIELKTSKLIFKYDNIFKVEVNDQISLKERNNKLTIKEKSNWFNDKSEEVIIYLPHDYNFNEVSIEAGSGNIDIYELNTKELDFDLGAGAITINTLKVFGNASIDAGAGHLLIESGNINNLDLDMGVGKTIINGYLTGSNDIDAGIGELELNLKDSINNYNLNIEKGIGDIKINGTSVNNRYNSNIGNNKIEIDGGIGNILINTLD